MFLNLHTRNPKAHKDNTNYWPKMLQGGTARAVPPPYLDKADSFLFLRYDHQKRATERVPRAPSITFTVNQPYIEADR